MAVFEGRSLPRKSGEIGENRQKSAYQQAPNKGEQDGAERRPEKRPGPEIAASRDMARSEAGPLKSRALPLPGRFLPIFTDFYRILPIFLTFLGDFNPQKLPSRGLRTLWEWKNRVLLEEYYIFNVAIPLEVQREQSYETQ